MKNHLRIFTSIILLLLFLNLGNWTQHGVVHSQGDDVCTQVVASALQIVGTSCTDMGRNEACYGHTNVQATFHTDIEGEFNNSGDIVEIINLESILTEGADPSSETWGIALLNLQADLPDDSEDSVMLVLFGDAEIASAVAENTSDNFTAPMQAITFQSGDAETCEQAPDGLLIRSPEGQRSRVMVNGVELTLSSATFITAGANDDMNIQGLEGEIDVTAEGQTETVTPGFISTVSLDENFEPDAPPTPPEPVDPNIEFPFEVFTGVFPDTDSISSGLSNTYSGSLYSFMYPEGWVAQESQSQTATQAPVIISNNPVFAEQSQGGFDELPASTTIVTVFSVSDFTTLLQGTVSGSTVDEVVRSYAEQLGPGMIFELSGPETLQIGSHSVTRVQISVVNFGSPGGNSPLNYDQVIYGFENVILWEYSSSDEIEVLDQIVQDIISSFSFDE